MPRDVEDKEQIAPADNEDVSSSEPVPEEARDESRRDFLTSLGKWSGTVIGLALLGAAMSSTDADADADAEGKPESSWRCWRCRCRCRCV